MTIEYGEHHYRVHRVVVCVQSNYFRGAHVDHLQSKDGEADFTVIVNPKTSVEREQGSCGTGEDKSFNSGPFDPLPFEWMIHYFYHHDYLESAHENEEENACPTTNTLPEHLILHAQMYVLGERFGIPGLKLLALEKYKHTSLHHWDSIEFAESLVFIYKHTTPDDKALRKVAVWGLYQDLTELYKKSEIRDVVRGMDGLSSDLVQLMMEGA